MDLPRLRVAPESPATDSPATLGKEREARRRRPIRSDAVARRPAAGGSSDSVPDCAGPSRRKLAAAANHGPCSVPPQQPRRSLLKRAAAAAPYTASAPPTRAAAPPGRGRLEAGAGAGAGGLPRFCRSCGSRSARRAPAAGRQMAEHVSPSMVPGCASPILSDLGGNAERGMNWRLMTRSISAACTGAPRTCKSRSRGSGLSRSRPRSCCRCGRPACPCRGACHPRTPLCTCTQAPARGRPFRCEHDRKCSSLRLIANRELERLGGAG